MKNIRNFSIIAHIDHGKSTLSDRLIQFCGGLSKREMSEQVLDTMDLEKERGITIKAQSVTIKYLSKKKKKFYLNFIDTPGHVNFSYEVSRSLAACEGALLVIDAAQGVQAQTVANCKAALKINLKIIPVLNKIDLPNANTQKVIQEVEEIIGLSMKNVVMCSAKTGTGITELLEKIVLHIPKPSGNTKNKLQALIIDSWFDQYTGVVFLIRIKNGIIRINDKVIMMNSKKIYKIEKLGIFTPKKISKKKLLCGEVGWMICGIKNISSILVGETITSFKQPAEKKLPGFDQITPKIYAAFFPIHSERYIAFRDALTKLQLNDSSLFYEPETSKALGFGFRCGFLGILHLEIIKSRLEREYNIELIVTTPTVIYEILLKTEKKIYIDNPDKLPKTTIIKEIREPIANCNILTPIKYIGEIIKLCISKRGIQKNLIYHKKQAILSYEIPLSEIILNFFDQLKSISSGYASLEYNWKKFKKSNLVKLEILINSIKIDSLSLIQHKESIIKTANKIIKTIQKLIPRHQFSIFIQAKVENKIIARANIKQLRKNVIAKCYGGDVSRKKKLLKKQKKGKKKMKTIGNVNIPQKVFFSVLKTHLK